MVRTMDGTITSWSQGAERLYGWGKTEAQGRVSHRLLQTIFPQPLAEIESELVRHGIWEGRLVHTTRDGNRLVVASRWILDNPEHAGTILEVNRRLSSSGADLATRAQGLLAKIATGILAGGAVACLLAFLFVLYHYQWTRQRQFTSFMGVVVYQLVPALAAVLLVAAALWLPPGFKVKLAMLFLSMGISVGLAETVMTLWFSLPSVQTGQDFAARAAAARTAGVPFDARTKQEVVRDLRRQGVDAAPTVWVRLHVELWASGAGLMPIGGVSNQTVVLCNESGAYVTYDGDEHGFHNPKRLWSTRVEVAALGDSFAQGFCVPSEKNFVALMRNQYPTTLNLGMAGQGPLTTLATLKEYLPAVKPRTVLWFYYEGNDLSNLTWEAQQPVLMRYLVDNFSQGLLDRQPVIDQALRAYLETEMERGEWSRRLTAMWDYLRAPGNVAGLLRSATGLNHMRRAFGLVYGATSADSTQPVRSNDYSDVAADVFPRVMAHAQSTVGEWAGKLYFVYLPEWSVNQQVIREDREAVLDVVRRLQIPIIDVKRAFQAHEDPSSLFSLRMPGHYNEAGHQLVAAEVLRGLSQSRNAR